MKFGYRGLGKTGKGLLRRYMGKVTGMSRAQLTRLIRQHRETGRVEDGRGKVPDVPFERLAGISNGHLYNLRHSLSYRRRRTTLTRTRPTAVAIGERRRPCPDGRPGYIRVDTVHQGDGDGHKGVYHVNLVDEVTQWQHVGTMEAISERFLVPVLEALLQSYPFVVQGFHSDNGSEYINHRVANLLNRTMIGATSGIAAKYLSRAGSEVMVLLGAGWLAPTQVIGHCAVRSIREIRVYCPTEEHKLGLCKAMEGRVGAKLIPVGSTEDALKGADIIACATNSYEPVFDGSVLKPGHYVGSLQVGELDDLTHEAADTITARAREPATIWHMKTGETPPDQLWMERWKPHWNQKLKFLGEIVEGLDQGRTSDDDITLFGGVGTGPSSGLGLQYILAWVAYHRAREQGIGFEIPDDLFLQDVHP